MLSEKSIMQEEKQKRNRKIETFKQNEMTIR